MSGQPTISSDNGLTRCLILMMYKDMTNVLNSHEFM